MSIQYQLGRTASAIGYGFRLVGNALLFAAIVLGLVAVDLVILAAIAQSGSTSHPFLTGFLCGTLFGRDRIVFFSFSSPLLWVLVSSLVLSGIAIGLSVFFGVPFIGIIIAASWASVGLVTGIGLGFEALGAKLLATVPPVDGAADPDHGDSNTVIIEIRAPEHMLDQQPTMGIVVADPPPTLPPYVHHENPIGYLKATTPRDQSTTPPHQECKAAM